MMLPTQFNIMPVRDKKPQIKWADLTEREQTREEKQNILKNARAGEIGIVTGPISRVFVLDDDGGLDVRKYHIPNTWTVKTPRGGTHYYFRWIDALDFKTTTRTEIFPKVDVRGQGGYVVFYGWEKAPHLSPLASPPQWLIDLLPNKEGRVISPPSVSTVIAEIKDGNRNDHFFRLASSLRSRGYDFDAILGFLKPKAKEVGFSEEELRLACKSAAKYPISVPNIGDQGQNVESFLADKEEVKWICNPFIAEQSIGFIGGLPESRKSWILIDLAVECAKGGGLWLNKFPVEGKRVLLIDQERSKGEVQRRLQAVIAGKNISPSILKNALFVRSGTSTRIDLQHSYDALRKEIADIKPELILIDSFATFHTKNESNRMEIQQVMERIKEIRNEFKCSIIIIHHETKQAYQNKKEGAESSYLDLAGNVAIPAAAEFVMNVVRHDDGSSWAFHTKSTQGSKAAPFLVYVNDLVPDGSKISVEGR